MEFFYGWIRSLTGYFLFMLILEHLLPGKKYGKYIRLFAGMVLILLVLQPLAGSLRLDEKMVLAYEEAVFRYQAGELKEELLGIGDQQLERMIGQYEEAVELDLRGMAEQEGLSVRSCRAVIGREEQEERFGMVTEIQMEVSGDEAENAVGDAGQLRLAVGKLGRKIAAYYDLEEGHVEIQIVEGKR